MKAKEMRIKTSLSSICKKRKGNKFFFFKTELNIPNRHFSEENIENILSWIIWCNKFLEYKNRNKKKKCEINKKMLPTKTPNTKPIFEDRYGIIFVEPQHLVGAYFSINFLLTSFHFSFLFYYWTIDSFI